MSEMDDKRYDELMNNKDTQLTDEEYEAGWHWCLDWDGLLIGPGWPEMDSCWCHKKGGLYSGQ